MPLPLWLVYSSTLPRGRRLPPMKKWLPPPTRRLPALAASNQTALRLEDFRYWRGIRYRVGEALCRACFNVVDTTMDRARHMEGECKRLLDEALALLMRDYACVVCDKRTYRARWGVPICGPDCEFKWMFEAGAGSAAVLHTLKLLKARRKEQTC